MTDATNVVALNMTGVTNAAGNTGSGTTDSNNYVVNTVTVSLSPSAGALTAATFGSGYSVTLSASAGAAPYSYAVTVGALPAGLSLGTSTGAITGTPTAVGIANFTVTATDSNSITGSAAYSMSVQAAIPAAPTIGTATAGNAQASVTFTVPVSTGGSAITGYTVTSSPEGFTGTGSTSPIIVTSLINGTPYTFTVTATNGAGTGLASAASNAVTPAASQTITFADPGAQNFGTTPTLTATASSGEAVTFTSSTTGVCTITSGGALSLVATGSCTIAADQAGTASYSAAPTVSHTFSVNAVNPDAPIIGTATAGNAQASVTFTVPVSTGGSAITGYTVISSPGGFTQTGSTSPIIVTSLINGTPYTFTVTATNGAGAGLASAASNAVTPAANETPVTEFTAKTEAVQQTATDNAMLGLSSALSANQSMMQAAKGRFVAGDRQDVALDVDGSLTANPVSLSTMGTFFGQSVIGDGPRRLVFGGFDVQHNDESGASTVSFNGKIAWEYSVSDTTMLGYFIGGDLAKSNIEGRFTGDQDHLGLTVGGYGVHELAKQLYLDGFVSFGSGRNNLSMVDDMLALESEYTTRSASFGASVSGVITAKSIELWPELALSVGRTWIDAMDFTATAYGETDETLSLGAAKVTQVNLTFRPELRLPLDGATAAKSRRLITLAPRLMCQQTSTTTTANACGGGAGIGLQTLSFDGMTTGKVQIQSDRIGGYTSTVAQLGLEHRF